MDVLDEFVRQLAGLHEAEKRQSRVDARGDDAGVDLVAVFQHDAVRLGVSPRASLSLFRAAQASAALAGRDYVLPDDIKRLSPFVLVHRIILSPESRLRGRDARQIIDEVVNTVSVPVEQT